MKTKEILCAKKFTQIYLLFRFLSEDLTLTQKPSICFVNYENKNEPNSLDIYFLIIMRWRPSSGVTFM